MPRGAALRPWLASIVAFTMLAASRAPTWAAERSEAGPHPPAERPGTDLFTADAIRSLQIEIGRDEAAALGRSPRGFVRATVRESGLVYSNVAIHLKGRSGSFRPLDDKPSLTLDFSRFDGGPKFHGLRRLHLNNSVEDPACVNEVLGSELFNAAGVPAPRVTRAVVQLNGRRLGLYVLKEGFTEDFLAAHFRRTEGNLYDTDLGHDVNERLQRNLGTGPESDQSDLEALAAAALTPDPEQRWTNLQSVLDLDRFLRFMALEVMVCHRDGYCLARNNFRIYHDLDTGRMVFLPHGMDQLFGKADLPWRPHLAGLVANAIMETPRGPGEYRARIVDLCNRVFRVETLTKRVDELVAQVRPVLELTEFRAVAAEAEACRQRIRERARDLGRQLSQPELALLEFREGVGRPGVWTALDAPADGRLDRADSPDRRAALHIRAGRLTAASWRARVLLPSGRYRFEGRVRTAGLAALPFGRHQGAALWVAGFDRPPDQGIPGAAGPWHSLAEEFQIESGPRETELVCELRASAGEAWFDLDSLRVVRMQEPRGPSAR